VKLLVGYAVLTHITCIWSADPDEWDNLVPTELAELADIPTCFSSRRSHRASNMDSVMHRGRPPSLEEALVEPNRQMFDFMA